MFWEWTDFALQRDQPEGINLDELSVDEAYLKVKTDQEISLYTLSDDCYRCPFVWIREVNGSELLKVSTKFGKTWRLYNNGRNDSQVDLDDTNDMVCEARPKNLGQFGVYALTLQDDNCNVETELQPVRIYTSLLIIAIALITLSIIVYLISYVRNRCKSEAKTREEDIADKRKRRVAALDTFRGICIALMIFVNNGGGQYWFFEHATWNGLYIADFIFPWFLWIMGVCIPISIGSHVKKSKSRCLVFFSVLKRSVILFLLGLALNTIGVGADLSRLRIMGVLQRFSICYFVVAVLVLFLTVNFKSADQNRGKSDLFSDLFHLILHWPVVLLILAGHCYLSFFFLVPQCPKGYLGPGGIELGGAFKYCTGGATGYLDKKILGVDHIYQNPTSKQTYLSGPFDPEGLVGCLTSVVQVFLGVQAGVTLMFYQRMTRSVVIRWLVWALLTGLIGLILCQGRQDGGWVPVNKNLWSLSYVCITTSCAYFLLSLLYYLIDVKRVWSGAPFNFPGMNAMILYVGHQVCYQMFPWHWTFGPMNTHFMLTIENLWGTALWIFISYCLYRNRVFLAL